MNNAISTWFSRLLLILICLSPILVAKSVGDCYTALTAEKQTKQYLSTLRCGYIYTDDLNAFAYDIGKLGYSVEIEIERKDAEGYFDHISEYDVADQTVIVNGRKAYSLVTGDFVHIIVQRHDARIHETTVYRGSH